MADEIEAAVSDPTIGRRRGPDKRVQVIARMAAKRSWTVCAFALSAESLELPVQCARRLETVVQCAERLETGVQGFRDRAPRVPRLLSRKLDATDLRPKWY
jgi:hypothetical protein